MKQQTWYNDRKKEMWYSSTMMRLILGRAGTGKTARIFREISESVKARQGDMVLLVPEQYSHEAERELCRAAGDSLSLYGEVLSFTGLARKVFAQCGGARPVMDGGGRLLCMAAAMEAAGGSLRVYRGGRRDVRLMDELVRAVEELKNAGADGHSLSEAAERFPGVLGEKLRDLSLLLEAYAAVQGRSAADPADVMETLASRIGDSRAARCRYYVDGFSDFTELEKKVLRELIRAGASMTFCLTCARSGDEELFAIPRKTVRWLRRTAEEYAVPVEEQWLEPEGDGPLAFLRDHLFDFTRPEGPACGGAVRLVRASDPYEECELAAAHMAELARNGARYREMAVAARGFGDYRAALESACAGYGVPLFLSGRGDMLRKNVPILISSALEAVIRGYEYEAVFGCLKTGLAPIGPAECDILENYVLRWNIRGGGWTRPFTMHPDGFNQVMDDAARERLETLNALRERVMGPFTALEAGVKAAATAAEQARALGDFLMDIRLPERLAERAEALTAADRRETAAEYERLWDVVCGALEQFAAVLGELPMDGDRFRELFCLMLSKYDVGVIPVSLDRVQAGDLDGMRRRHIRHLLVLGCSDGRLPAPDTTGGVFTPEERAELTELGLALGGPEEDLSRELWRIYSCLSLPSDTLYMSWPAAEADGSETRPSLVAERARTLFDLTPERGDLTEARTWSPEAAYTLAVRGEAGDPSPACAAARAYFREKGMGAALSALVTAARADRGRLDPAAVRALYGDRPALTPTRAEKFGDCRFAYFMQYGLKAKPRTPAVFDPRDYGTFMHYVLENVAREVMDGEGFREVTGEHIGRLTDKYVDAYIREEMKDFADRTPRFEYLFRRLRTTVHRVTEDMWQELKDSRFQPLDLELDLGARDVLEPEEDDGGPRLYGRADRVDGWVRDGVLYLRITDYKTGVKKFSLSDVCEGVNLQMLLYLFTLEKRGKSWFGAEEIRPAGVLYSPARYDVVRADEDLPDEELAALRRTSARRSGLVLADEDVIEAMEPGPDKRFLPVKFTKTGAFTKDTLGSVASLEQFGRLSRFIDDTLRRLGEELRSGSVEADPWYRSARDNACLWCDYAEACLFDETKDCRRPRMNLSPDEAWEKIGGSDE